MVGVLSLGMGIMVDISCGSMEDFPGGGVRGVKKPS